MSKISLFIARPLVIIFSIFVLASIVFTVVRLHFFSLGIMGVAIFSSLGLIFSRITYKSLAPRESKAKKFWKILTIIYLVLFILSGTVWLVCLFWAMTHL